MVTESIKNKNDISFSCKEFSASGDSISSSKTVIMCLQEDIKQLKAGIQNSPVGSII